MPESYPPKITQPAPMSAIQWLDKWARERVMYVPRTHYGHIALWVDDIAAVSHRSIHGNPDLVITTSTRKRFYVLFHETNTYHSMDLPVLVWPPKYGLERAFWIMPVGWRAKGRR